MTRRLALVAALLYAVGVAGLFHPPRLWSDIAPTVLLNATLSELTSLTNATDTSWMSLPLSAAPCSATEALVHRVHRLLALSNLLPAGLAGVEWWTHRVSRAGQAKTLHMHADRDEQQFNREGVVRNPVVSTVLYVTSSSSHTLITDGREATCRSKQLCEQADQPPRHGYLVRSTRGHLVAFDGTLVHGVMSAEEDALGDCNCNKQGLETHRLTLLMNWWANDKPGLAVNSSWHCPLVQPATRELLDLTHSPVELQIVPAPHEPRRTIIMNFPLARKRKKLVVPWLIGNDDPGRGFSFAQPSVNWEGIEFMIARVTVTWFKLRHDLCMVWSCELPANDWETIYRVRMPSLFLSSFVVLLVLMTLFMGLAYYTIRTKMQGLKPHPKQE